MSSIVFSEFKRSRSNVIPDWLKSLPDDVRVTERELSPGQLVGSQGGMSSDLFPVPSETFPDRHDLYLVTEGRFEIFDVMPNDFNVLTFRPIRLLCTGDVFGEFLILDRLYPPSDVSPGIIGEIWQIAPGPTCFLPCAPHDTNSRELQLEKILHDPSLCSENAPFSFYANKYFADHCSLTQRPAAAPAKLARLELTEACLKKTRLLSGLYRLGWMRARSYRDSLNSFNWHNAVVFRERAYAVAPPPDRLLQRKILVNSVVDAVLDALTRPLRNEPCFASPGNGDLVLHAANCRSDAFCFPIDLHNYFISAGIHHAGLRERQDALDDKRNDMAAVAAGTKSKVRHKDWNEREQFFPPNMNSDLAKMFPPNGTAFGVYKEFVESLRELFLEVVEEYPYDVRVAERDGFRRRMLLLEFTPKLAKR